MNRRQRALLLECLIVLGVVLISIVLLINLKDWTNRREALRAMGHISQRIEAYANAHDALFDIKASIAELAFYRASLK